MARSTPTPPANAISAIATAKSALAQVVAASHQADHDRFMNAGEHLGGEFEIDAGNAAAGLAGDEVKVRAAHVGSCHADEEQQIARFLQVHAHAAAHVGNLAHGADEQSRRDDDVLAAGVEFVVEAVLAAR